MWKEIESTVHTVRAELQHNTDKQFAEYYKCDIKIETQKKTSLSICFFLAFKNALKMCQCAGWMLKICNFGLNKKETNLL